LAARAAAESGDLVGARAAGERAIALAPELPEGYRGLGILLAQAGGLDEAAAVLERGRFHFPRSADLFYDSGVVSAFQNQPVAAIAFFERVLELDPGHAKARENLAGMLASAGRFDEATKLYRRAIESSPADLELRILLARSLAGGGRLDEARAELRALLAAAPGHPAATELWKALGPELN
jgi:tetratricopeptide (TPR) repeat protein